MKIECVVDGKTVTLNLNSDKPLSLILSEDLDNDSATSYCNGKECGNCIVLVDGKATLACLMPAFAIRGSQIVTFDSFSKSKKYKDIEKAYDLIAKPCPRCLASRTMLIEHILSKCGETGELDEKEILVENAMIKCTCLDDTSILAIVKEALASRRKPHVRRA